MNQKGVWIYEQGAIDTVIAIKPLKPGDRFQFCRLPASKKEEHMGWRTGKELEFDSIYPSAVCDREWCDTYGRRDGNLNWTGGTSIVGIADMHFISRANIHALWIPHE